MEEIINNLVMYLRASDVSTFSPDYKEGYRDCILDINRYLIKNTPSK